MVGIRRDPTQLTECVTSGGWNPLRQERFAFWICAWLLFVCVPLYGIDRDRKLGELYHTAWTFKEGAPPEIHALAQTIDGFLWLGTASGLFRFDGIQFQPYKPASGQSFPQRSVVSLLAVPDGGLWVGYRYGGVSFIKNGTVTDYGISEGLPSQPVWAFARDRQGAIWIATGKGGLARFKASRWQKIGSDWGFAASADTVFVDHAGIVWVGTETSVEYLAVGGHHFQIAAEGLVLVKDLAESFDGTLWMAEQGYGVRPVPLPGKAPGPAVYVGSQAIAFDEEGSLWIASLGTGIRRVPYPEHLHQSQKRGPSAWQFHSSEVQAFTEHDGLTSDFMYCALQDREGNVWLGTSAGLDQFRQSTVVSVPLQPISYPGALPIPSLHSFTTSALAAGDQGALWAAGMGPKLLLKIQKDRIVTQLRDRNVESAYRDREGAVWLATSWSKFCLADECLDSIAPTGGTLPYDYHGSEPAGQGLVLRQLELPKGSGTAMSPRSFAKAIAKDRLGRLWVSMESGTFRLERSGWTSLKSLGGPGGTASAEFTDTKGRIWFGFTNTVAMLDGDTVHTFSAKDGVQVGGITSVREQGTKIWIGGEFGLEYFDGSRFQLIHPSNGTDFAGVSGIVPDPVGGLWFSDNRGIIHIRRDQPQAGSSNVEVETLSLLDGLTAGLRGSLASPSAVRTTDGRIWFATTKGVAWIDPKRIVRNTTPPPVSIESVIANGMEYSTSKSLRLPSRITNLQIVYTATSLTIPERVRFRYKLEGLDTQWQDAGTRREAFYTKLDPGSYQFRVIACNNDWVWNDTGASVSFSIAPAYYQTIWIRALCVAVFIVLIWMIYMRRVRSVEQRYLERSRAEEALRHARSELAHIHRVSTMGELTASLAHEIRQPIAAAMTDAQTSMRWLNRNVPDTAEAREAVSRVIKDVARASDIIKRIRLHFQRGSPQRERIEVNEVVREMVALLDAEMTQHTFAVQIELAENLPPVVADRIEFQQILMNLMLNGMESMKDLETPGTLRIVTHNAEDGFVQISVIDTGKGIEPEQAENIFQPFVTTKPGGTGMGLAISRSIIESHGGRLWFTSDANAGVAFHFTLPIAASVIE